MKLTLSYQGAHHTVKLDQPKTSLLEVLADFCEKQTPKLDVFEHEMRHNHNPLPLTSPANILNANSLIHIVKTRRRSGGSRPEVRIAVQLADGTRLQGKFRSSTDLWSLLVQLEETHGANLTHRTEKSEDPSSQYMMPIISFQNVEVSTIERLKTYSLAKLGLSKGGIVLRLAYKKSDITFNEVLELLGEIDARKKVEKDERERAAQREKEKREEEQKVQERSSSSYMPSSQSSVDIVMGRIGRIVNAFCKEVPEEQFSGALKVLQKITNNLLKPRINPKHRTLNLENEALRSKCLKFSNAVQYLQCIGFIREGTSLVFPPETENGLILRYGMATLSKAKPIDNTEEKIPDVPRELLVLHVKHLSKEHKNRVALADADETPDFDVRKHDFKLLQQGRRDDKRLASELNPQVLISKEKLEQMKVKRKYEKTIIRIQFPSKLIVQGCFHPQEKLSAVIDFVRELVKDEYKEKNIVFFVPPTTILGNPEVTLKEANLIPAAVVYFRLGGKRGAETTPDDILRDDVKALCGKDYEGLTEVPNAVNSGEKPKFQMDLSRNPHERKKAKRSGGGGLGGKGPKWFR